MSADFKLPEEMLRDMETAALVELARRGVTPDIGELLVYGDPRRGVPRAKTLRAVLESVLAPRIKELVEATAPFAKYYAEKFGPSGAYPGESADVIVTEYLPDEGVAATLTVGEFRTLVSALAPFRSQQRDGGE